MILGRFAVPLFIFISGFILTVNYRKSLSVKSFLQKRFLRILIPYIIFSCAGIFLYTIWGEPITFDSLWRSFAYFNVIGYYYFIAIILELYLLFPILLRVYSYVNKKRLEWLFVLSIATIQVGYYFFDVFYLNQVIVMGSWNWVLQQRVFVNWIFFFVLGIAFAWNYLRMSNLFKPRFMVAGCAAIVGIYALGFNLSSIIMTNELLIIASGICNMLLLLPLSFVLIGFFKGKQMLKGFLLVSELSFVIYLVHGYWQQGLAKIIPYSASDLIFYPILFIGVFGGSLFSAYVYYRITLILRRFFRNSSKNDNLQQ